MWTLGQRGNENSIKVMVKEFQRQIKIHIRHYYKAKDEDRWYPTKKGVALSLEEWDKFIEEFTAINSEVPRLRSQNEKVVSVPPTGVKRNVQPTFDSSYE